MDEIIKQLENEKIGEKYHDFRLDRAILCLNEAKDIMTQDPKEIYDDAMFNAKTFYRAMPFIYVAQESIRLTEGKSDLPCETRTLPHQESVES